MAFSEACEICCKMNPDVVEAAWGRYQGGLGFMAQILRQRASEFDLIIFPGNSAVAMLNDLTVYGEMPMGKIQVFSHDDNVAMYGWQGRRAIKQLIGSSKTILVVDDMEKFNHKITNLRSGFDSCDIKAEFLVMATLMNSRTPSILGRDGQVVYMLEDRNDAGGIQRGCEKVSGDVFCNPGEMQPGTSENRTFRFRQPIRLMQIKEGFR